MCTSPYSSAASAAYCDTTGAHVTRASWTVRMSRTVRASECRYPTRQPVIPYALENVKMRTTRRRRSAVSASVAGLDTGCVP